MALPINIEELIHGKVIEWERLEFKKDWNPEAVLHTLCAFANDINNWGGGYIILGVEESKGRPLLPPTGLAPDRIDDLQGELTRLGHRIHPQYLPILQPYVLNRKHILVIWAPAGDMRPYSAPKGLGKGGEQRNYYVRSGSRTIQAQGENLRRLQELTARIPFDDRINQQAKLNDLDLGLIREFLHEVKSSLAEESAAMSLGDLARQLAIAKGPNEHLRPVNVGLMFFNKAPESFYGNAWIEVVIRKDEQCTYFLTILPVHPDWVGDNKDGHTDTGLVPDKYRASSDQVVTKYRLSRDQVPTRYKNHTDEIGMLILTVKGEMGLDKIMDYLNFKHKHYFRKNYLQPALEAGFIEMTIPDKPKSSKQKYRLTEKGRKLRQQMAKDHD